MRGMQPDPGRLSATSAEASHPARWKAPPRQGSPAWLPSGMLSDEERRFAVPGATGHRRVAGDFSFIAALLLMCYC